MMSLLMTPVRSVCIEQKYNVSIYDESFGSLQADSPRIQNLFQNSKDDFHQNTAIEKCEEVYIFRKKLSQNSYP